MSDDLQPIQPTEAVSMWIDRLQSTRSDETLKSYRYRLQPFVDWCGKEGIDNLNDLTSRDIIQYDSERRAEGLKVSTLNNQLGTLKQFIQFAARIAAVDDDLPAKVEVPTVELADRVSTELLTADRAEAIREKLDRYERGSRRQAIFELLWHTGCRLGGLHALDVDDFFFEQDDLERLRHQDDIDQGALDDVQTPFVYFRHREGTPLKNKHDGERPVILSDEVAERVRDYIEVRRPDRPGEHNRRPLLTTSKGETARASKSSTRREIYIVTQPCRYGSCPHDRDTETCEALEHSLESRCPSARSPHPIRTGAITNMRDEGWPPEVVAERVNATPDVIRAHYDHPDPIRRMESRRKFLEGDS